MAHLSNLSSSIYTTLTYVPADTNTTGALVRPTSPMGWRSRFVAIPANATTISAAEYGDSATAVANRMASVREFPAFGNPANIVNVPVYGQNISSQVVGQADAPTLEFTLNYIPTLHYGLDGQRRDGNMLNFRIRIATAERHVDGQDADQYADFYFQARVASLLITPSLSDSTQATIALAVTGEIAGPYAAYVSAGGGTTATYYGFPGATAAGVATVSATDPNSGTGFPFTVADFAA